jgi:hypothetical protein
MKTAESRRLFLEDAETSARRISMNETLLRRDTERSPTLAEDDSRHADVELLKSELAACQVRETPCPLYASELNTPGRLTTIV